MILNLWFGSGVSDTFGTGFINFVTAFRVKEVPYGPIKSKIFWIFFGRIFRDIRLIYRLVHSIALSVITFKISLRYTQVALYRGSLIRWFWIILRVG